MRLTGNTILITGGAGGIGLALTKKLADLGNKVVIAGRNEERLKSAEKYNSNIKTIKCELTNENEFEAMLVELENNYPDINVLINNAAVQYNYYFADENMPGSKIDNEIKTNLAVPVKLTAGILPILIDKNESAIVYISSALAFAPKENASVYCATKAAVHNFTISMRYQLEKTNIKVFEIIPPLVNTNMTKGRGKSKIEPEVVAKKFISSFGKNEYEINIGKAKVLRFINRLSPNLAHKILRKS